MTKIRIPLKKPSSEQDRIIIRLPDGLHERLKAAAEETRQTMTQVAVSLMEQGLARYELGAEKIALMEKNADEAFAALNEIMTKALSAKSALQAYLLAERKQ